LEITGPDGATFAIDRFWRDEEGIRAELQAWAAWLETLENHPHRDSLMLHLTGTQQVFVFESDPANAVGLVIGRQLAEGTDGVLQIDGQGFLAADGSLLVPEE
jgi:hypothetical protein